MRDETSPHRIEHNVATDFPQVGVSIHELGGESTLQHMAASLVSPIESLRVDAVEVPHRGREVRLQDLQQQMIVITHKAIRVASHVIAGDDAREHDQEPRAVVIIFEDRAPVIPARSDVVDPAGKLEPERPGHGVHATAPASVRSSVPI
jgi:hypothetical protein